MKIRHPMILPPPIAAFALAMKIRYPMIPPPPIAAFALWTKVLSTAFALERDVEIIYDFMSTPDWQSRSPATIDKLSAEMQDVEEMVETLKGRIHTCRLLGDPVDEPFVDRVSRQLRRIGAAIRNIEFKFDEPLTITLIHDACAQVEKDLAENRPQAPTA